MMTFKHLDWDSDFFQIKIGKLNIVNFEQIAYNQLLIDKKVENYSLIYLFSSSKIDSLNSFLIDEKVIYEYQISTQHYNTHHDIFAFNQEKHDETPLLNLALQSGEYSRYRLDKKFPEGSFEKMYALWIENSLNRTIADEVFIYQKAEQLLGMVTLKHENTCSRIGLIAVDTAARGQNIGTHLLNAVKETAQNRGKLSVEVATQLANQNACNFYEKNNFKVKKIEYIYHIWL